LKHDNNEDWIVFIKLGIEIKGKRRKKGYQQ
jgi:hypothetical protein